MPSSLSRGVRWLSYALIWVAGLATVFMVVHTLADVAMRYFMGAPLAGTSEIATHYYLVPMTFLPLAVVELRNEHVVVEAFTHFLPDHWIRALDAVVRIVSIAVLVLFTWRTALKAIERTEKNEIVQAVYFNLWIWPVRWVLPVSLAAFALAIASRLFEDLRFERPVAGTSATEV